MNNCWKVLGIEKTKKIKVIKKAYAKLLKQYHPEDDPEKFMEIKEAYKEAIAYAKVSTKIEESRDDTSKDISSIDNIDTFALHQYRDMELEEPLFFDEDQKQEINQENPFKNKIKQYLQEVVDETKHLLYSNECNDVLKWKELFLKYYGTEELILDTILEEPLDLIQNDVVFYYLEGCTKRLVNQSKEYKDKIYEQFVNQVNKNIEKDIGPWQTRIANAFFIVISLCFFLNVIVLFIFGYKAIYYHVGFPLYVSNFFICLFHLYQSVKFLSRIIDEGKKSFSRYKILVFVGFLLAINSILCCYIGYLNLFKNKFHIIILIIIFIINIFVWMIRHTKAYQSVAVEIQDKDNIFIGMFVPTFLAGMISIILILANLTQFYHPSLIFIVYTFYILYFQIMYFSFLMLFSESNLQGNRILMGCGICNYFVALIVIHLFLHYLFGNLQWDKQDQWMVAITFIFTFLQAIGMILDWKRNKEFYKVEEE